ncbi:hypothetical protein [Companilactobacillus metriopterae]|uniref:hypothetical protein n=1 Tax=Companilactobacillus metriopterae TaxID=1909267 RepID=UPI00100B4279|nr:hypothetical protein [Companilactobacillus metriopterae]
MKHKSNIMLFILAVPLMVGSIAATATGSDVNLNNAPKSGEVTLNDNDNIISASSAALSGAIKALGTGGGNISPGNLQRSSLLFEWGHSNCYSRYCCHGSYAQVENSGGSLDYVTAKGYGTFIAKYTIAD